MKKILSLIFSMVCYSCTFIHKELVPNEACEFEPITCTLSEITENNTDSLKIISSIQRDYNNILLNAVEVIDGKIVLTIPQSTADNIGIPRELYQQYLSIISEN